MKTWNPCNDHQSGHVDNGCPTRKQPQPASPNAPVATEAAASPPGGYRKADNCHGRAKPSRLVQALDSNQDGKLSLEEIEAAVAILKGLDQDGNGELTSDEFGPVVAAEKPTSRSILRPSNPSKPSTINRPNRLVVAQRLSPPDRETGPLG